MRKSNLFIIALVLFLLSVKTYSQNWIWGKTLHYGEFNNEKNSSMKVDFQGNIFIAGSFVDSIGFDSLTCISQGGRDIFLAKLDSSGRLLWAKNIGGKKDEPIYSGQNTAVTIDSRGNCFLSGILPDRDTVYFGIDTVITYSDSRSFVAKYDSQGDFEWIVDWEFNSPPYMGEVFELVTDPNDNIYLYGEYSHYLGGINIIKLNNDGEEIFRKVVASECHTNGVNANDIAIDRFENIYVTSSCSCTSVQIENDTILVPGNGSPLLIKYDSNGNYIWHKAPSGSSGINNVTVDNNGSVILSGEAYQIVFDSITLPHGLGNDMFLAKYDSAGNLQWAKKGPTYAAIPYDAITDCGNNIYFVGVVAPCSGCDSLFVEKYSSAGNFLWHNSFSTFYYPFYEIDLDGFGAAYIIGTSTFQDVFNWPYTPPTLGIAKLFSDSSSFAIPPSPFLNNTYIFCDSNLVVPITAIGTNINWYSDVLIDTSINQGPVYNPHTLNLNPVYVTQTLNGCESYPRKVLFDIPNFSSMYISVSNDTLFAPNADTYQWLGNNVLINNANEKYIIVDSSITYSVILNIGGCVDTVNYINNGLVEIAMNKNQFLLFPNPTAGTFEIYLEKVPNKCEINIYNLSGEKVYAEIINSNLKIINYKLNPGMYFIRMISESTEAVQKLVVQ